MQNLLCAKAPAGAIPIVLVSAERYKPWLKHQTTYTLNWLKTLSFTAKPGSFCVVPDAQGKPERVIAGIADPVSLWDLAALPCPLAKGVYRLDEKDAKRHGEKLALGWLLGAYRYSRYKKNEADPVRLAVPGVNLAKVERMAEAILKARDLINTPAADLGPAELAAAVVEEGKKHGAKVTQIVGDALRTKNYPAIHAVGRASTRPPRLVDLTWGNPKHPKITLVGKGVCFDTGGLDLKTTLLPYKKDMGGAAAALGVAMLIMANKLPVRLRLLIPTADNVISGNAYFPGDVITMRDGQTVEVTNTDAEGRLLLADALAEAITDKPALLIDFATLTGAERVALGTNIAGLFTNDDRLADALLKTSRDEEDPVWRLPLHAAYDSMLDSKVADMVSAASTSYAGAITAALFLQRFVGKKQPWIHLDFMAWNLTTRPGRPEGGEADVVRAVYRLIEKRFRSA